MTHQLPFRSSSRVVKDSLRAVLCHLWIVFDTHKLNVCEFLFEDHLPSMEDDGRWGKMMEETMEDDLWTLENVLKGLVSSLDRFWYPWVEFLWIFIWGSSSINGRWWKTMEDDGRWRKMMENVLSYHIQHFWYFVIWCRTIRWATVLTNVSGGHNGPPPG